MEGKSFILENEKGKAILFLDKEKNIVMMRIFDAQSSLVNEFLFNDPMELNHFVQGCDVLLKDYLEFKNLQGNEERKVKEKNMVDLLIEMIVTDRVKKELEKLNVERAQVVL